MEDGDDNKGWSSCSFWCVCRRRRLLFCCIFSDVEGWWSKEIISAVAVPEGNRSFSRMIVCFRKGTAKNTPKKATPSDQSINCQPDNTIGPSVWSSFVNKPSAGMMPTKPIENKSSSSSLYVSLYLPAANGMVAVATAVVWRTTFSTGPNGLASFDRNGLKTA